MEDQEQSQRGDGGNRKTPDVSATCSNKVPIKKSDLNPVGNVTAKAKGNQNITGARSKISTRNKYAPLKSVTDLTSKDLSTYRTNKNKAPSSSTFSASQPKESQSSGLSKEISKKPRAIASSLIPVKKNDTKTERKASNFEFPSSIKKQSSTKKDTKTNQASKQKGIDQKPGTVISFEKEFEEVLLKTPAKPSAHSGITFKPKTKFSPSKNIFAPPTDDSSNVDQSSSAHSTSQPSLGIPSLKLASKVPSKNLIKEATEKTRTGVQSKTIGEKTHSKPTDKGISTKMLRSKTEASISTGPGLGKKLQKVKSFSKPRELATKKPAHQAVFDLTLAVKEEPTVKTVELPPVTSAHSGVPFKPKKRSSVAAVNIFAQNDKKDSSKK